MTMHRILIVDDDRETCRFMAELLTRPDREVLTATQADDALDRVQSDAFDLLVSDINLNARQSGLDVLKAFKSTNPEGQVLLISGFGTLDTAIAAVRAGAFDYISKPFNIAQVKETVDRALAQAATRANTHAAPREAGPPELIGRTAGMLEVYKQIARAADSTVPVLITGESGTGKELVARAIHANSPRSSRPFIAINCGAIPDTLLESELFGHTRGSFTGAVSDTKGLFEQAHGGTIFLDEVGEMPPALQVKLLRTLEDGEVRPVGAARSVRIDARVIAATNADLEQAVGDQKFRQDLYYRLGVIVIRMPPLRDRPADVPLLVERFLQNANDRAGRRVELAEDALAALAAHDWPGNVRELENTVERLVLFSRGSRLELADLPAALRHGRATLETRLFTDLPSLDELERRYLVHVLEAVGGNRTRAAEVMGIDRRTFYRMAERFGVDLKD
jgi:DNA-binding NtrC family response regulator